MPRAELFPDVRGDTRGAKSARKARRADKLKDQTMDATKETMVGRAEDVVGNAGKTVKRAASRAIEAIKAHPVPALLIAAVFGFLACWLRSS